ncbi:hypothetical protein SAMN04489761_0578 [Tenacibaculum sp. MAR_2009_124]|nr:hypothetical protein SAMN04489761_0578 [Tenacibaculum sp. MAR_2009_124]
MRNKFFEIVEFLMIIISSKDVILRKTKEEEIMDN